MAINVMHSNGDFQLLRRFVIKSFFSNSISTGILGNFIILKEQTRKKNMIYKLFIRREEAASQFKLEAVFPN